MIFSAGEHVLCTRKTMSPRMLSWKMGWISPSLKREMVILPKGTPNLCAILSARYCEPVPEKILGARCINLKICGEDNLMNYGLESEE